MIATKRKAGLIVSGALLLALVGCKAEEPPVPAVDHAQTVQRDADTPHVDARPVDPAEAAPSPASAQSVQSAQPAQ